MFAYLYAHWYQNFYELRSIIKQFYGETSQNVYESNIDFRIIWCQIYHNV